jgi:hypothetical protein
MTRYNVTDDDSGWQDTIYGTDDDSGWQDTIYVTDDDSGWLEYYKNGKQGTKIKHIKLFGDNLPSIHFKQAKWRCFSGRQHLSLSY